MSLILPVTLTAKDIMDPNMLVLDENTTVSEALKRMVSSNVWSLLVSRKGDPVGVVTDRDILRRCVNKGNSPSTVRLGEIMSSPLLTIPETAHIGEIMQKMVEKSVRRLFVTEQGKIIGRVTQTGLFDNSLEVMMSLSEIKYQM